MTPLRRGAVIVLAFTLGALFAAEAVASIRRGWVRYHHQWGNPPIERRDEPRQFWAWVTLEFVFAAVCFYAAVFFAFIP